MLRRSLVVVVAAVTAILLLASAVGAAVRPFNAAQIVAGGCSTFDADSVLVGGGSLFGYATCQNNSIRFFSRQPNGTVNPSQDSGFSGRVMAVTADSTASYVLFSASGRYYRHWCGHTVWKYSGRDVEVAHRRSKWDRANHAL